MEKIDATKLIECVKVRPTIWDMAYADYGDRVKRKEAWDEIVSIFLPEPTSKDEVEAMEENLQRRWKNLRDRYARDIKGKLQYTKAGRKKVYIYSRQLSFLKGIIQNHKTNSNSDVKHTKTEPPDDPFYDVNKVEMLFDDSSSDELESSCSSLRDQQLAKRKKMENNAMEMASPIGKSDIRPEVEEKDEDDNRYFLLSLLPSMKMIPDRFKLVSRMEIMEVINKYASFHDKKN